MPSIKVWNSELVQQAIDKLRMGIQTDLSCFHENDIELKAANILFQLTSEETDEFDKCSRDIVYFVEKYCRFLTDKGRTVVKLRSYQKKILRALADETYDDKLNDLVPKVRNIIMLQSRQSGKTTTITAYFAWYMCFHYDRNLAILANKQATAFEIVSKVTDVFKGLPFFLKPGIINIGSGGMRLDNGCFLTSQATTKTAQIGFTIHVLYADEFAHIQKSIANDFWRSVYPTLSSSNISQCIISSTPNGTDNIFFEIWDKSQKGLNSFVGIRVDWWEVPGRDEEWRKKTMADFGEENFAQEFELNFNVGGSNLLLRGNDLMFMNKIEKQYVFHELKRTDLDESLYKNLKWHPNFDPNDIFDSKKYRFVLSVDTGEGKDEDELKDNDYNVCNIFKVEPKSISSLKKLKKDKLNIKNMFRLVQVGLYRDNIKDEENCANVTKALVFDQFGSELCKVIIEMNFNGKYFLDKLANHSKYDESVILHTYHTKPIPGEKTPRKKTGFKVTGQNKDIFCKLSKKLVNEKTLILNEKETIKEFKSFGKTKNGKWRGIGCHDDIAMSTINISHLYEEKDYEDWLYDFLNEMEESDVKKLMFELLEEYTENTDINDEMFHDIYLNDEDNDAKKLDEIYRKIYRKQTTYKYKPSFTFDKNFHI